MSFDARLDDDRAAPECSEHPGHESDRCEPCEAHEVCDACGGSRVVEFPAPGRPYSLKTICFCDDTDPKETTMKMTTKVKKARASKRAVAAKFNAAVEGAQVRAGVHVVNRMAAQGDVLFRRVDAIPTGAKLDEKRGPIVVAHSETGHHHSIDEASGAQLFRLDSDPMVAYLRVEGIGGATVTHHRDFDTHAPILLTPGNWEVKRQREYVPGGWRRVED